MKEEIHSYTRSLREILQNHKYTIHYYQREYRWQKRQITQLLDDLLNSFNYKDGDTIHDVVDYPCYFMGSIIDINDAEQRALIDGQQRLTSFTLLLLYLNNRQKKAGQSVFPIDDFIFSNNFGVKSFNMNFPNDEERTKVLSALFQNKTDIEVHGDSAITMLNRYKDLANKLDTELPDEQFECFFQWTTDRIEFIEIIVDNEQDAYKIFVSMNDRGLVLTGSEMLKGFILSRIDDDDQRNEASAKWTETITKIKAIGGAAPDDPSNNQDNDFFQIFLRSKYAQTIRSGNESQDQDYELLGSEFHEWIFKNASSIGLRTSKEYYDFAMVELPFFADIYCRLMRYAATLTPHFEALFYNALFELNYQFLFCLGAISRTDDSNTIDLKINLISRFVDLFSTERGFNFKKAAWNSNKYFLFRVLLEIREKDPHEIAIALTREFKSMEQSVGVSMDEVKTFSLNNSNKRFTKYVLARLTSFMDEKMGHGNLFPQYINTDDKSTKTYDIEHVLADRYDLYGAGFDNETDFEDYRAKIGNLVLLTYEKNRSYGDDPVSSKVVHYLNDNPLAASFNPVYYSNNPAFLSSFKNKYGFKPYDQMGKQEILERSSLYEAMAKDIWDIGCFKTLVGGWGEDIDQFIASQQQDKITRSKKECLLTVEEWVALCPTQEVPLLKEVLDKFSKEFDATPIVKEDYIAFLRKGHQYYFAEVHCWSDRLMVLTKKPTIQAPSDLTKILPDSFHWALGCRNEIFSSADIRKVWPVFQNSYEIAV